MLSILKEFDQEVDKNGISRKDIQMLELELGENIISSRININRFTEHKTTIGIEEYKSIFTDILNRKCGDTNKLELYQSNQTIINNISNFCKHMLSLLPRLVFSDQVMGYISKKENDQVFEAKENSHSLVYILDKPYIEAINSHAFEQWAVNLTLLISNIEIRQKVSHVLGNLKTQLANVNHSAVPIVDFLTSAHLSNYNGYIANFFPIIQQAYEDALYTNTIYSLRDLFFIKDKVAVMVDNVSKLNTVAELLKPTEVLIDNSTADALRIIKDDWWDNSIIRPLIDVATSFTTN